MSANCGRCKEKDALFECADCVGSKRRGELLPLCDACNELIHVGFLADHQVISVAIKEQKRLFEEQLKVFKNQGKHLQLKLNEINYARQDIEQRAQYKQQGVSQALQSLWQALKQKEKELTASLRDESKEKSTLLAEWEKHINLANKDFQNVCSEAQKLLQGDLMKFSQNHEEIQKKIDKFEVGSLNTPFPTLSQPMCLDVSHLLQTIKELCLKSADDATIGGAGEGKEEERGSPSKVEDSITPQLQSPKQGDILQIYVESRLDPKGRFWVSRNLKEDVANMYENLSFRIREDIVKSPLTQVEIEEGMLCCSQFQEDHRWYRGRVEQLKKDKGLARVRWLDYAHDNDVAFAAVHPLKEEFQKLPFQALEFCLFDELEEDLPHQARWEFSDHTANVILNCEILKQMAPSSGNQGLVYLVDLKNPHKATDIKGVIMEKAEEARCKKDTVMCRDIRYMKDYVPPISKTKDTTPEKTKEAKQQKKQKKDSTEAAATETSKSKEVTPEKLTAETKDETKASQGVIGQDKDSTKTQQGGGEGAMEGGTGNMEQENGTGQVVDNDAAQNSVTVESLTKPCKEDGTEHGQDGGTKVEQDGGTKVEQDGAQGSDTASKTVNGEVNVSKPEGAVTSHPDEKVDASKEVEASKEDSSRQQEDGLPDSQEMTKGLKSQTKAQTNDSVLSSSDPNGQMSGSQPSKTKSEENQDAAHAKRKTRTDSNNYSIEPGIEDEELGDDQSLVERLAVQSNWVMANSPDNACSVGGSSGMMYQPYGSMGFYGSMDKPPVPLGLDPIVSSTDTCSSAVETSKPSPGTFTGDGFKIAVDSSFSIYVATPLSDNGRFWASRLRGPAQESQLRRLMHDISVPFEPLTLERLKDIKVVCAQSEAGLWCRARVEGFADDKVRVRYVDFGQAEVVEVLRIKTLPATHQLFPYQALELSLATKEHPRFSQQARDAFARYTQGRILTARVLATEPKCVCVSLTCVDDKQLVYDISTAVLNINSETRSRHSSDDKAKERHSPSEHGQNEGSGAEDHKTHEGQDARYDNQSDGRSHDRGSGDRCFVCYNVGHLSYDCPMKKGDRRNKGGPKKQGQGWGRRNRKY